MNYRRRENDVTAIRYDGTMQTAKRLVQMAPSLVRKGELIFVTFIDPADPKRRPRSLSQNVGDWIVWATTGTQVPMLVPEALFRVLFEEDLPRTGPHAPGAAEKRAGAGKPDATPPAAAPAAAKPKPVPPARRARPAALLHVQLLRHACL